MKLRLSAQQVAERLEISTWTVPQLARNERLPSVQIGRGHFAVDDIQQSISKSRAKSRAMRRRRLGAKTAPSGF